MELPAVQPGRRGFVLFGRTNTGDEVVDGGSGEGVASDRVESLQMNTKTVLIPSVRPDFAYI